MYESADLSTLKFCIDQRIPIEHPPYHSVGPIESYVYLHVDAYLDSNLLMNDSLLCMTCHVFFLCYHSATEMLQGYFFLKLLTMFI